MRPAEIVRRAADYLERHDVEGPLPQAEILLAQILDTDRAGLYSADRGLSAEQARRFGRALCLRCAGTPLQHLTGEQGFRRLTIEVRSGVFIPRPETEVVVEQALAAIDHVERPLAIDVGTGTGAIALALKDERPDARIVAIDVDPRAIELARENAARLKLEIEVLEGDLLDPVSPELQGRADLVVSNPPYLPPGSIAGLPLDVRQDPAVALFGGIETYVRLFQGAIRVLRPGGAVVVEIDDKAGSEVGDAAASAGLVAVLVLPDLVGRDRVLIARTPC